MMLFLLVWILMVAAAGGLAVGMLWGRAPRKGSCAGSEGVGCALACRAEAAEDPTSRTADGSRG